MTDVQQARIEAAARAMLATGGDGFGVVVERNGMSLKDAYTEYARAAIAAADAVKPPHSIRQEVPWPPYPEADYMYSQFSCKCGWFGHAFIDIKGGEGVHLARVQAARHCGEYEPEVSEAAIERAIMGRTATAGAKAVQRLYRGEEQS